jgi:hypothetical protein
VGALSTDTEFAGEIRNGSASPAGTSSANKSTAPASLPSPVAAILPEAGKPVDAQLLILNVKLKTQLKQYEAISQRYIEARALARTPGTPKEALLAQANQLSYLIEESKALEDSIRATTREYNALLEKSTEAKTPR